MELGSLIGNLGHRPVMEPRKRALIFIDFDVLVRHFVKSKSFAEIEREYDVTYVAHDSPGDPKRGLTIDLETVVSRPVVKCIIPRKRSGYWYLLFAPTVMRRQRGKPGYEYRRKMLIDVLGRRNVRIFDILSLPGIFEIYRFFFVRAMGVAKELLEILDAERPDIVIQPSVLTGPFINELLRATKLRRTPYFVLMNSWDNPATKAVVTGEPDLLGVWGAHSRALATKYIGLRESKTTILGSAQFDVYRRPPLEGQAELAAQFGVPAGKRIVLYAGAGSGWYETAYLKRLDAMTEPGGALEGCHILYRPHPWRGPLAEGEEDFFSVHFRNVTMDPHLADFYREQTGGTPRRGMYLLDYETTNRLLKLVSAVISPLSTILLEAALMRRPILIFVPPDKTVLAPSIVQPHFRDLVKWPEVNLCLDEARFEESCRRLNQQVGLAEIGESLRTRALEYVDLTGKPFAARLLDAVDSLTGRRPQDRSSTGDHQSG